MVKYLWLMNLCIMYASKKPTRDISNVDNGRISIMRGKKKKKKFGTTHIRIVLFINHLPCKSALLIKVLIMFSRISVSFSFGSITENYKITISIKIRIKLKII